MRAILGGPAIYSGHGLAGEGAGEDFPSCGRVARDKASRLRRWEPPLCLINATKQYFH